MTTSIQNPFYSIKLFGLNKYFVDLIKIYNSGKFPNIKLITGKKGIGKFTLVNHFMNYIYDKTYDNEINLINLNSEFNKQYLNNVFSNIFYLGENNISNIKVDEIRNIKNTLSKSNLENKPRFFILDNIENFNINSLNALLKILEDPGKDNYFILIHSNEKPLLETILSRSLISRIHINQKESDAILTNIINEYNLDFIIDKNEIKSTPGNLLRFNTVCIDNSINLNDNFLKNLDKIFRLFKNEKNKVFINLALFLSENYFNDLYFTNKDKIIKINNLKIETLKNINEFVEYNLNQQLILSKISNNIANAS